MSQRLLKTLIVLFSISQAFADPAAVIRRDRYGVPHILARSESAAAFAHGFAAAEDHADLMARLYLRAQGRQAEYFGTEFVEDDFLVRQLEIRQGAERDFAKLTPLFQEILRQYAAGYNLYLSKRTNAPPYARPITPIDLLAHFRMVLLVDFGVVPPRTSFTALPGSSMWALGHNKTTSGHGILLINPHLSWNGAFTLHEVHLRVAGKRDVYGVTMIGSPIVTMGFNSALGWTHTTNQVDISDVYKLVLDKANPDHYLYEGMSLPLRTENAAIHVKVGDKLKTEERKLEWSHHGPVMRKDAAFAYALKTIDLDGAAYIAQWYEMGRAANYDEFQRALKMQGLPMLNIGYADREGNVLFLYGGRVPIRRGTLDWRAPVPGDVSDVEWLGIHPFSDMPLVHNPASGYIQNCNEPPWFASPQSGITPDRIPAYIAAGAISPRTQLSLRMLEERQQFSLDDVVRAKFTNAMPLGERLRGELTDLLESQGGGPELKQAASVLRAWDTQVSPDSRGAFLFLRWWAAYSRAAKPLYRDPWSQERALVTPGGIGDKKQAMSAMDEAIRYIHDRNFDLDVRWGDVHRMRRGNVDVPIGGGPMMLGCFRSLMFQPEKDGRFSPNFGDTFVLAAEFSNPPTARAVLAYSESSDPRSKHYSDQSEIFARATMRPVWFTEDDIKTNLERSYSPAPLQH